MPNPVNTTSNHALPLITPLDTEYQDEWGFVLNDGEFQDGSDAGTPGLMDVVEERLIIRDTDANKSNYTAYQDAIFWATDGPQHIYVGDGTNWGRVSIGPERSDALPISALDDGDSMEIAVLVPDTATLNVYEWGAFDASDGTAPTGLDVELLDGADTVQTAANTTGSEGVTPVASYQNTSGSESVFKLRAKNDSGATIDTPGVSAFFGFEVDE